jgi:hypothetical protein
MNRILRRICGIACFANSEFGWWLEHTVLQDLHAAEVLDRLRQPGRERSLEVSSFLEELREKYGGKCSHKHYEYVSEILKEDYHTMATRINNYLQQAG